MSYSSYQLKSVMCQSHRAVYGVLVFVCMNLEAPHARSCPKLVLQASTDSNLERHLCQRVIPMSSSKVYLAFKASKSRSLILLGCFHTGNLYEFQDMAQQRLGLMPCLEQSQTSMTLCSIEGQQLTMTVHTYSDCHMPKTRF